MVIELIYSNKTERLLEELAGRIKERRSAGAHPLEPVELVVPNRNMGAYVRLGLAQALGVAANLRFNFLNRFIEDLVSKACPGEMKLVDLDTAEAALLGALSDENILAQPEMGPVRSYLARVGPGSDGGEGGGFDGRLAADGADLRRVQLAGRMAFLFQEYVFSRPEMIAAWRGDGSIKGRDPAGLPYADPAAMDPTAASTAAWQAALWRAVFGGGGILAHNPPADGARWMTMDQLLLEDSLFGRIKEQEPPPVHIFGVSYMARLFQDLLARLGEVAGLHIYSLNPCAEFWEDVETDRQFYRRLDRELNRREKRLWSGAGETGDEDPFGLFEADTPALRYWGRPGREHVRLLGELTDCDFTGAFADPLEEKSGLLQQLQRDILLREPERNLEDDGEGADPEAVEAVETVKVVPAPSVRREVEWVADEIWRLMRGEGGKNLRFSDVAIIVNSAGRDTYLPHLEAVFKSCHNLPCSITDLPGASSSRLIEAMSLLLKLPFGRFSRTEMLTFMGHPAVMGNFDNLTPDDLTGLADALGIVFGADRSDHAGTYIDEDIYHWDQGLRRLALGVFMTGEKSGDRRIFETDEGRWLVEELSGWEAASAARFGLLARSLISDARFVCRQEMTLTDWARFYTAQLNSYLCVEGGADEGDRLRLLRALGRLEKMDLGFKINGRSAAEIARRAVGSLEGGRGQYLAEGVVVSSFLPMRAIPFKAVFLLGLGEGLFPASAQKDALDLRAVRRRAGDVDPSERDRYMFLETLLCTRERLYLSYVNRDEHTGDPLQPSAVVQELLHMLEKGYLGKEGVKALFVEPSLKLRRYDEPLHQRDTFFDEAYVEARVQELARDWKERLDPGGSPGEELSLIRQHISREQWEALSRMLALPGRPPASPAAAAAPRQGGRGDEEMTEAPLYLSLNVLRRFLECPMQGWASALLGLAEVEEDAAYREEEDFAVNRLNEIRLLNDTFYDTLSGECSLEKLYRERAERLRLTGQFPAGVLGQVIEKKHLAVMEGWRSLLAGLEERWDHGDHGTALSLTLHRVRIGAARQQGDSGIIMDPLALEVPLEGPEGWRRVVPVRIGGLTEGLSGDRLVTVIFRANKPPRGAGKFEIARWCRHLLKGLVAQAALSALNETGAGERQIIICCSNGEKHGGLKVRLQPLDSGKARRWLTTLAAELLRGPHAYLLPCEAAYLEYRSRRAGGAVDGGELCSRVKEMAGKDFSTFSSLWGPVPFPHLYDPPPAEEAARMADRRFEPFFGDIINLEVF